jgi:hypothetical protein
MNKTALAMMLALTMAPAVSYAEVGIRMGPPPPVAERPGPPPERGLVWIPGYHQWSGAHYVWMPGHYMHPPHPGAHWIAHHWVHRHGEWVLIEGHWK